MGPIALLCLRLELPEQERKFRLPFANLFCLVAFYFCNLISYWTGWDTMYKLAIAIVTGFVFFGIACARGRIKQTSLGMKSAIWVVPYLGGLVLLSYLGSFGGKNVIPFGWDFLVIAIFSVMILYLAVMARRSAMSEEFANVRVTITDVPEVL
jgi:peptidoglycan/LPS O-acetylase OafA/YrhL